MLGYLSSDDRLEPDAVSGLVAALQASPALRWRMATSASWMRRAASSARRGRRPLTGKPAGRPGVRAGRGALFRRGCLSAPAVGTCSAARCRTSSSGCAPAGGRLRPPPGLRGRLPHPRGFGLVQVMPPERADEILRVVQQHWAQRPAAPAARVRRSTARALTLSARIMRSPAALGEALQRYATSAASASGPAAEPALWRQIVVGFARRWHFNRQMAKESSS